MPATTTTVYLLRTPFSRIKIMSRPTRPGRHISYTQYMHNACDGEVFSVFVWFSWLCCWCSWVFSLGFGLCVCVCVWTAGCRQIQAGVRNLQGICIEEECYRHDSVVWLASNYFMSNEFDLWVFAVCCQQTQESAIRFAAYFNRTMSCLRFAVVIGLAVLLWFLGR